MAAKAALSAHSGTEKKKRKQTIPSAGKQEDKHKFFLDYWTSASLIAEKWVDVVFYTVKTDIFG